MERLDFFRKAITGAMTDYAKYLEGSNMPKVRYQVVEDAKNDTYQLLAIGWENHNRIYYIIFHADIINGHIWIQEDNTEEGFANLFVLFFTGLAPLKKKMLLLIKLVFSFLFK